MIPMRKYDPKVFRMLTEFTHSGSVNQNAETVLGNRLTHVHVFCVVDRGLILFLSILTQLYLSHAMKKCVLCHMRTTKALIRLRGCAFVVRCQDRMIPLVYISEISRF